MVGVLDTGINATHEQFAKKNIPFNYIPLSLAESIFSGDYQLGFDTGTHGTHVCGVIAGSERGVAPESELFVSSVIESETVLTSLSRVVRGLNWLWKEFTTGANFAKPAIITMSLGFESTNGGLNADPEYKERVAAIKQLIGYLVSADILPIAAVGNSGEGTVHFPGALDEVIGVGCIDNNEAILGISGSGKMDGENNQKPDIVGYGVDIKSGSYTTYTGEARSQYMTGTSQATPYVAGIAALYRERYPNYTVGDIKKALADNAEALALPAKRVGSGLASFKV
jgi:subtilisin family serine protease